MKMARLVAHAAGLVVTGMPFIYQADADLVGLWEFEDADNLRAATIGSDLALTGTEEAVAGSDRADAGAALIGDNSYYTVTHGIAANGGGNCVNEFTLLMDINYPASSAGNWLSLWQTNTANSNDGDLFIHVNQTIGIAGPGYSSNTTAADTWYRVVLSIDNGSHWRLYVNGSLWVDGEAQVVDGRFSLDPIFHVMADENGEEDPVKISNLALWDEPLDEAAAAALGGAGAPIEGAPTPDIRVGPFVQSATTTSIWIVWETDIGEESRVDYGLTPALGNTAFGDAIPGQGAARIHRTELTGLSPDTYYYYQVSTETAVVDTMRGELHHFRTPPVADAEQSFRFAAYSDPQIDAANPTVHSEVINEGIIDFVTENFGADMSDELAFVLCPGDLVDDGTVYSEWKTDYFDPAQDLLENVPLYAAIGNHEQNSHWYFDYLVLPDNGTAGFEEHWYYVDYGNVRIIGLDSNSDYRVQPQLDWLDAVLADAGADAGIDFVFAQLHHPHKSELWLPGEIDYTGQVIDRLEQFSTTYGKPSIHFFGHTHGYSRGQSKDHQHLWVNVASGGGNIDYWGEFDDADYAEFQVSQPEWGFVLVEVDAGGSPRFRLRRVSRGNEVVSRDNEVTDDITIRVDNPQPSQPAGVYPTIADSPVNPDELTLWASAYSDPDMDPQLEAQYQITATQGDYSAPLAEEWLRVENWYSPLGATGMADGITASTQ